MNGHNKGPEWVRIFKMDKIWLPIDPRARLHINANIFMASLSLSMNFNSSGHLNFQTDQVTMSHVPKPGQSRTVEQTLAKPSECISVVIRRCLVNVKDKIKILIFLIEYSAS